MKHPKYVIRSLSSSHTLKDQAVKKLEDVKREVHPECPLWVIRGLAGQGRHS